MVTSLFHEATSSSIAGVTASLISNIIMFPLERIRLQMQVEIKKIKSIEIIKYDSDILQLEDDEKEEYDVTTLKGFYKGITSMLFGVSVTQIIFFYIYTYLKYSRLRISNSLSTLDNLIIASVAGICATIIVNPIWIVNMRLTLQKSDSPKYNGIIDCFKQVYNEEGLKSFYTGIYPALALVSNPAIQFVCYEQLTRFFLIIRARKTNKVVEGLTVTEYFFLGAVSKAISTVLTYPYLLLKSRAYAGHFGDSSMYAIAAKIYREEGFAAFFNGLSPKFVQTVLNAAFMFACYEYILKFARNMIS